MSTFTGFIDDAGKLTLDSPAAFKAYAKHLAGNECEIDLRKRRSKRSDEQNKYWWGVVVTLLAEHCGYTRDEMHDALKVKFLGAEDMSKGLVRVGSTTKLTTLEFADLTERVMLWAAEELGVVIPSPEREPAKRAKRKAA